jgi:hypothetical protein
LRRACCNRFGRPCFDSFPRGIVSGDDTSRFLTCEVSKTAADTDSWFRGDVWADVSQGRVRDPFARQVHPNYCRPYSLIQRLDALFTSPGLLPPLFVGSRARGWPVRAALRANDQRAVALVCDGQLAPKNSTGARFLKKALAAPPSRM